MKDLLKGGNIATAQDLSLDKQIDALHRIANNTYLTKYPRKFTSTASGLNTDQCRQILATLDTQEPPEQSNGPLSKFFNRSKGTNVA